MKPIIIVTQEKDKITLTEEELKKYILEAYEQGVEDGKALSPIKYIPYEKPYRQIDPNDWKVTCDTEQTIYTSDSKTIKPIVKFEK